MPNVGIVSKTYPQLSGVFLSVGWNVVLFDLERLRTPTTLSAQEIDLLVGEFTGESSARRNRDWLPGKDVPWLAIVTTVTTAQQALELAAAEVMFAPVNHHEVVWRAHRILAQAQAQLRVGSLNVNLATKVVELGERIVALSANEFRLLTYFTRRCGHTIDCEELLSEVWGCSSEEGGTRDQVKCCIRRLRRKIERDPKKPEYLVSVKGSGYLLRNQDQWGRAMSADSLRIDTDLTPAGL